MEFQDSGGRLAFVCAMAASAVLGYQLFRTRGGALLDAIDIWRGRGRLAVRRFWFFAATMTPFLLVIAACSGYYYSSVRLSSRIYLTAVAAFLLLIGASVVMRWSLLARRRLAMKQAKRRREAKKAEAESGDKPPEEPELDLEKVDSQTGRLVRSTFVIGLLISMWFIWAEFLPALSILNELQVWETQRETVVQRDAGDGQTESVTLTEVVPITWRDIVVALLVGVATFIAVQNIPGLLEIAILQRLPLVAGERYAVQTIFSYALVLIGFLWAINTIGVGWSQVQWLVAAVGLGLGFGLQEIFANFIAGIIILFEQPIRVGDTVTVGDISGRVSKIRIRATWITAFNRQELIVPNKEFVTNRLVNWTLSDQVLRVEIPIGIAYGSDTRRARRLMLEEARKNKLVLNDPAPEVWFLGFGDNSLNFELRAYSPNIESFLRIRDQLNTAIDDTFRNANIEIAFPQRDIHIRSIKGELPIKQPPQET
jgi:potassium-dependent mechanosensitive channel